MKVKAAPGIEKQVSGMHYGTPTAYVTTLPLMGGNRLKAPHGFAIPLNLPILSSRGCKVLRTMQTPTDPRNGNVPAFPNILEARKVLKNRGKW